MRILGVVQLIATFDKNGLRNPVSVPFRVLETYDSIDGPRSRIAHMAFKTKEEVLEYVRISLKSAK